MIDRTQLTEALDTWESYLAGIHTCDFGEPEAVAILHINEGARFLLDFPTDEQVEAAEISYVRDKPLSMRAALEAVRWSMIGSITNSDSVSTNSIDEAVRRVMFEDKSQGDTND